MRLQHNSQEINVVTDSIERFVNQVICADSEKTMRELPSESVHLIVTSPPYWNMVDYGAAEQIGQSSYGFGDRRAGC